MIAQTKQRMIIEEFEEFIYLPENVAREFELIAGEIFEAVSNSYSSMIAASILSEIGMYVRKRKLGYVTGADGGYIVTGERYIPDVGFISIERQPRPSRESYNSNAPDLAVEVISPTDSDKPLHIKIANYLAAGTVVWVVHPDSRTVEVFHPGQAVQIMDINGVLDGGDVLPGFTLAISDIFPDENE
jgi:Uma2 family endonuclease